MVAFEAFGLVVAEMGRSLQFYRQLGLELEDGADHEPHVECVLPGGVRMMFDTIDVIRSFSDYEPPLGGFRIGLAFRCESPAEVDRRYRDMVDAGHPGHLEPFDAFWGQRYATILDPDGNPVDLFAPLAD